jgi:flagellar biosynthesis GTPase FlhF
MKPETPTGETPNAPAPSNASVTPTAPVQDNSRTADVEAAKREAEQARMRANQLENELKKFRDEQEAARQKQLEEQQEYRQLYEQTESKLREMQQESEAAVKAQALSTATETLYKDYPETVVDLAKTAGLTLTDDSEAAQAALKTKLDELKSKFGTTLPQSNNPSQPVQVTDRNALVARQNNWEGSPMAMAAVKGDLKPTYEYIRSLPAIQKMKEMSQQ